jgi:hypothetical protein
MKKRILIIVSGLFLLCFGWAIVALLSHAKKLCAMENCINICYDIVRMHNEELAKFPDGEINIERYYQAMAVQENIQRSWDKHIVQFVKNGDTVTFTITLKGEKSFRFQMKWPVGSAMNNCQHPGSEK